ncbi:MAG: 3-methyl-2-oxobutanoate hydroxymethyltransferase, partial [Paramuribaculum sp.]|nr:3-methyl-2-oxobutanoate hydroxymethyltransferase [Paramuribaculum sp.]
VIGIGAGSQGDGQVLVVQDMLGMNRGFSPKFMRRYSDMGNEMQQALEHYVSDVKEVDFPNAQEQY